MVATIGSSRLYQISFPTSLLWGSVAVMVEGRIGVASRRLCGIILLLRPLVMSGPEEEDLRNRRLLLLHRLLHQLRHRLQRQHLLLLYANLPTSLTNHPNP